MTAKDPSEKWADSARPKLDTEEEYQSLPASILLLFLLLTHSRAKDPPPLLLVPNI